MPWSISRKETKQHDDQSRLHEPQMRHAQLPVKQTRVSVRMWVYLPAIPILLGYMPSESV